MAEDLDGVCEQHVACQDLLVYVVCHGVNELAGFRVFLVTTVQGAVLTGPHDLLDVARLRMGFHQQFIDVGFAVRHAFITRIRRQSLFLVSLPQRVAPALAFLLLDQRVFALRGSGGSSLRVQTVACSVPNVVPSGVNPCSGCKNNPRRAAPSKAPAPTVCCRGDNDDSRLELCHPRPSNAAADAAPSPQPRLDHSGDRPSLTLGTHRRISQIRPQLLSTTADLPRVDKHHTLTVHLVG